MNELILSEAIYFDALPLTDLENSGEKSVLYEFPNIKGYLNDGYQIKSLLQEPINGKNGTIGLIVTAILQKLS